MGYEQIAQELGITKRVAHKWGQAIKGGRSLEPRMGRPRCGALGSFDKRIAEAIDRFRPGAVGWGANTLRVELVLASSLSDLRKPSARSIDRYLGAKKRVRVKSPPVSPLPQEKAVFAGRCHDVWQMDAEGNKMVDGVGMVCPVNIGDVFSKAYIAAYPFKLPGNFSHLNRGNYQFVLRIAFMEFGLCRHLQLDHESAFYDNNNATPYPKPLHLWLVGLGIDVFFTPKGKPFRQGAVERKHQTVHGQVCAGREYSDQAALFAACQERRHRLNQHIPCRTLGGKSPFEVCPEAAETQRPYSPETEEDLFDPKRIEDFLAQIKPWYRTVFENNNLSLGGMNYYLKNARPNSTVQIKFDPCTKQFHCSDADQNFIGFLKPKGISFKELSGQLDDFKDGVRSKS
jgi:hypothetical protein